MGKKIHAIYTVQRMQEANQTVRSMLGAQYWESMRPFRQLIIDIRNKKNVDAIEALHLALKLSTNTKESNEHKTLTMAYLTASGFDVVNQAIC